MWVATKDKLTLVAIDAGTKQRVIELKKPIK
jgi:hypothetical protein